MAHLLNPEYPYYPINMKNRTKVLCLWILAMIPMAPVAAQAYQWSGAAKFRSCIASMQSSHDEQIRYNYAIQYFMTEHATTIQLRDACHYLYSDQKKYELCLAAFPNIVDKDHFYDIYDAFSTFSYAIRLYHNTQEKEQLLLLQNEYQLGSERDQNAIFDLLIQKGDILLSNNQFDEATVIYEQALEIKPGNQVAISKLNAVEAIQEELAAIIEAEHQLNLQFDGHIQQGDILLSANQVEAAIEQYERAMALKPGDQTAYLRIREANNWKLELSAMVAEENRKKTEYEFLMQKGDIFVSSGRLDDAIAVYQQASTIIPSEQMPYIRIEEVHRLRQDLINASSICLTTAGEFSNFKTSIEAQSFSDDQLDMAKTIIRKNCLSIEQMKEIATIFRMDDDKLEIITYMYDYTDQPGRFYEFRSLLRFSSTQTELDEFLLSRQ